MKAKDKVQQLQENIRQSLSPLIDRDYVLLDVPCHENVGDTLIWQGELDFLSTCPHKCIFSASVAQKELDIPDDILILFQGGGNFGDMWPMHHKYRKAIIEKHPNNPVLVFPQSVCYLDESHLNEDISFFSRYPNVTICVRDQKSKDFLDSNFKQNAILLVPDMAFMLDVNRYRRKKLVKGSTLFCKRDDSEFRDCCNFSELPFNAVVKDWMFPDLKRIEKESYWAHRIANSLDIRLKTHLYEKVGKWFLEHRLKNAQIRYAIDFVSPYEFIYTTRLHVAILSVLLGKKNIEMFDNSYGKLSALYQTWLTDVDGVTVH